jgi:hypothetical protein
LVLLAVDNAPLERMKKELDQVRLLSSFLFFFVSCTGALPPGYLEARFEAAAIVGQGAVASD